MELKNKIKQIILRVVCGIFLIAAIFLGAVAACYSVSGGTPSLFGTYVYLVETEAFDLLENGTALVAQEVHASEIQAGNIVIFDLENGAPALGEVQSGVLADGVYSFEVATENGAVITLSQSQIVAKGMSYSNAWGKILSFASSPLGVLLIAVVPCLVIIIIEMSKFISKTLPQPEIETVKKQLEVPTYTPETGRAGAVNAYKNAKNSLDDSIGLYDVQVRRAAGVERANQNTDVLEIPSQESPLFLGPKHKPVTVQKRSQPEQQMPLSQKKLNEAIAAARAERAMGIEREKAVKEIQKNRGAAIAAEKEYEEYLKSMQSAVKQEKPAAPSPAPAPKPAEPAKSQVQHTAPVEKKPDASKIQKPAPREKKEFTPEFKPSQAVQKAKTAPAAAAEEDSVKQYTPKKAMPATPTHVTTSIPRLDALLNEEVDEGSYNIDDILASLDRRG